MKQDNILVGLVGLAIGGLVAWYFVTHVETKFAFDKELTIYFPSEDYQTVGRHDFEGALLAYSKPIDPQAPLKHSHYVWFQSRNDANKREKLDGGIDNGPDLKIGSHITQYVSFVDLEKLESFAKATKCPSPTPCPLYP